MWRAWRVRGATVAIVVVACGSVWLLDHLRPRHAHFEARRGAVVEAAVVEEPGTLPGVTVSSVNLRAATGLAVDLRVLRPEEAAGRRPVVLLVGGHRTGRDAVSLVGHPGDVAVAAIDYPYRGPHLRGFLHALANLSRVQQAVLDTPPAVLLALDWLLDQPWADPERVELVGVSLGTPVAAVAGALDARIGRVWFLHGGADNREWLQHALAPALPSRTARLVAAPLLLLLGHGASFETASWAARIAPRPIVVVGAWDDEALPRTNVERLFAAASEPKTLIWTEGGHVQPGRPEIVQRLLEIIRAHL